jgi:hypothetical protein
MLLVNAKMFSLFSLRVIKVLLEETLKVAVKMLNNKQFKTVY